MLQVDRGYMRYVLRQLGDEVGSGTGLNSQHCTEQELPPEHSEVLNDLGVSLEDQSQAVEMNPLRETIHLC